jgi:hypothetical protein
MIMSVLGLVIAKAECGGRLLSSGNVPASTGEYRRVPAKSRTHRPAANVSPCRVRIESVEDAEDAEGVEDGQPNLS